jgi:hypothetical protein
MMHGAHLFVLKIDMQAALKPVAEVAAARNGAKFLSVMWHGEAFHWLGLWDVESLIPVDALFLLHGGRRREGRKKKKKKIAMREEGFPGAGSALLDMQ